MWASVFRDRFPFPFSPKLVFVIAKLISNAKDVGLPFYPPAVSIQTRTPLVRDSGKEECRQTASGTLVHS